MAVISKKSFSTGLRSTTPTFLTIGLSEFAQSDVSLIKLHRFLFYWVWVPVVQERLNKYRAYYNAHPVQKQAAKIAPTGVPPDMLCYSPSTYAPTASSQAIRVEKKWVDEERTRLGGLKARERLFQWYPVAFDTMAYDAWVSIGSPERRIENGWSVFSQMSLVLKDLPVVWNE
jgi:hypothetical protein